MKREDSLFHCFKQWILSFYCFIFRVQSDTATSLDGLDLDYLQHLPI